MGSIQSRSPVAEMRSLWFPYPPHMNPYISVNEPDRLYYDAFIIEGNSTFPQ